MCSGPSDGADILAQSREEDTVEIFDPAVGWCLVLGGSKIIHTERATHRYTELQHVLRAAVGTYLGQNTIIRQPVLKKIYKPR